MINPLSPRATVLAVLYSGPANGPELRSRAVKLSKGLVNPGQGSMYTTLFKLMSLKLIVKISGGPQKKGGKRMSGKFQLTAKGVAEAKKVRDVVETFFKATAPKTGSKSDSVARSRRAKTKRSASKANGKTKAAKPVKSAKARPKNRKKKTSPKMPIVTPAAALDSAPAE